MGYRATRVIATDAFRGALALELLQNSVLTQRALSRRRARLPKRTCARRPRRRAMRVWRPRRASAEGGRATALAPVMAHDDLRLARERSTETKHAQ